MAYIRQEIHGTTPQDIMKINENNMSIWEKVHGDINFSDTDKNLQTQILTQWLPVQGEGNLDKDYPLYIRFFVPPSVKTINKTSFNFIIEKYRMDSTVTSGGGGVAGGSINLSLANGGGYADTIGGGTSTSESGGGDTSYVYTWGTPPYEYGAPDVWVYQGGQPLGSNTGGYVTGNNGNGLGTIVATGDRGGQPCEYIDLKNTQHTHKIPAHTHTIPAHSHSISIAPHTHSGEASINIPAHSHNLNPGIYVSTTTPSGIKIYLNDKLVAQPTSSTLNSQDYTSELRIGEWNTFKITTTNLARITTYGTVELVIKGIK